MCGIPLHSSSGMSIDCRDFRQCFRRSNPCALRGHPLFPAIRRNIRFLGNLRDARNISMAENDLLNHSYNSRKPVTRVVQSIVRVTKPDQVWEFDIRYVRVHGESRNAYLPAMIDCHSGRLLATALDTTAQETT